MDTVFEINGASSDNSYLSAPDLAGRFIQLPPNGRDHKTVLVPERRQEAPDFATSEVSQCASQTCQAPGGRFEAVMEAVRLAVAAVFVTGLGTLGGWAMTLMFNSLIQAQSLAVQNSFVFQR